MPVDLTEALEAMLHDPDDRIRAMARNLLHDHRVPSERREVVASLVDAPAATATAIEKAVRAYHAAYVRHTQRPHFVEDRFNRMNILAGNQEGGHVTSKDQPLGRVLNLSKLADFYRWARGKDIELFETVPDGSDARIAPWLDERLTSPDREDFVAAILTALWDYQQEKPFEPCWATIWQVMEAVASEPPDRWNELAGIASVPDQWLILLRYNVRSTGTLVRPTQLDAGWDCYHFPSPPDAPLRIGGHPMDLCSERASTRLVSEYIHQQVRHDVAHWREAGAVIGKTGAPAALPLREHREHHRSLLVAEYGQTVRNWMPEVC